MNKIDPKTEYKIFLSLWLGAFVAMALSNFKTIIKKWLYQTIFANVSAAITPGLKKNCCGLLNSKTTCQKLMSNKTNPAEVYIFVLPKLSDFQKLLKWFAFISIYDYISYVK